MSFSTLDHLMLGISIWEAHRRVEHRLSDGDWGVTTEVVTLFELVLWSID